VLEHVSSVQDRRLAAGHSAHVLVDLRLLLSTDIGERHLRAGPGVGGDHLARIADQEAADDVVEPASIHLR
jgi:hypothetical protein